jgi:feruloyl-CoA synthase
VAEGIQALAIDSVGRAPRLLTGLGATETAPMAITRTWDSPLTTAIGLPVPGVEAKLVPLEEGRYEVRVQGPNVTPGYWRLPALTQAAFDDEGYYRMGDTVRFVAPGDPALGLLFDGRVAEDFKMSSGTWVHVGALRARIIAHFSPFIRDAVITGHDRNEVGMLAVPDIDACRALCPDTPADAPAATVLNHPAVRERVRQLLVAFARTATGSTNRVTRALLLDPPPLLDAQEVTDKGSLNQRTLLRTRASLVDTLYADPASVQVISHEQ